MAWLLLLFFRAAVAFGIPLQLAVHLLPPGNGLEALGGPLVGCAAALGGYVLAVRLGVRDVGPASSHCVGAARARNRGRSWGWR